MHTDVLILGAGLAGLSAANALAASGASVTVLERRPEIAGRAYSYQHPALNETLDSQHVVLGCCTNLIELCNQSGAAENLRWYDELVFLEPDGNVTPLAPGALPAPFHQTLAFLRAPMLTLADKARIAAGLMEFLRGYPADDSESFATWLKRTRQTERGIRHFWQPVVVGALNDVFERCSTRYAGKVFHESFLKSPAGGRLGIPAQPLSEFFAPVTTLAQRHGARICYKSGVESIARQPDGSWLVQTSAGETHTARSLILATNFKETAKLVATVPGALPAGWERNFLSAPITTVHLWYDEDVIGRDHAVLLDTRIEWVFTKSRIRRQAGPTYFELVMSASWEELDRSREDLIGEAIAEAKLFFPSMREAKLLKTGVLKEARATFSVTPGLDAHRPAQRTGLPNLYVAGDWTATDWPSTMEGAVRSGRLAAGEVTGSRSRFLAPELPASGLMRWLSKA